MTGEIFLTGATGFIGSGLLEKWLAAEPDVRLSLLVRGRRGEGPEARMKQVLAELTPEADAPSVSRRLTVLEGDIAMPNFGLDDDVYATLSARTSHIIHCAAAVRFDLPLEEARAINLGGSENALALARRCKALRRFDYVGTAYVAGKRIGLVKEDDVDLGQAHNNTYEETKLESEVLMRRAMRELPVTVYRPSIVVSDSRTGRISRYSAFFRMLKMYYLGHIRMLPGDPSTLMDIVPLDYVADAVFVIARRPDSSGKCYHLTAGTDNLTSFAEISRLAGRYFERPEFMIVPSAQFDDAVSAMASSLSEDQRDLIDEIRIYQPYLTSKLRFDNSNTVEAIGPAGFSVPRVSSYFEKMALYVRRLSEI